MNHYDALKKLMPIDLGEIMDVDLAIKGTLFDDAYLSTLLIIDEMFPSTVSLTLMKWEDEYGVVVSPDATVEQRRKILGQKVCKQTGLSLPYFRSLAFALGYTIEITESRRPWIVGVSKVGDWVSKISTLFECDITVDADSADDLEVLFEELKPPHLKLNFIYN